MYSNNNGFNLVDILIKIIFFIAFIFVLTFLFPQVKDLNPFYNNIFRENIKYMQDASENYFNNNLPTEIGETKKLTLKEMIEQNLIIPFVDRDNNSCNLYKSYAEIIKLKDGYRLKVNLVCNTESNYIEKMLGCNNFCDGVNCKNLEDACKNCDNKEETKKCYDTKNVTYYQFQKLDSGFTTSYYCEEGLSLKDGVCHKTVRADRVKAKEVYDADRTIVKQGDIIKGTTTKKFIAESEFIRTQVSNNILTRVTVSRIEKYVPGGTVTVPCDKPSVETQCHDEYKTIYKKCECKPSRDNKGNIIEVCNTCPETIKEQVCEEVTVTKPGTCTEPTPGYWDYRCPDESTSNNGKLGTDALQCYKDVYTTTYDIILSCPSYADGSIIGPPLQCYTLVKTSDKTDCSKYPGSITSGDKCLIIEKGAFKGWSCSDYPGYTQDGDYCNLDKEVTGELKSKTSSWSNLIYEWSTKDYMEGWARTGEVRYSTSKVEVPCK